MREVRCELEKVLEGLPRLRGTGEESSGPGMRSELERRGLGIQINDQTEEKVPELARQAPVTVLKVNREQVPPHRVAVLPGSRENSAVMWTWMVLGRNEVTGRHVTLDIAVPRRQHEVHHLNRFNCST